MRNREELYRLNILEHYRKPHNFCKLSNASAHAEDSNPLCGDELAVDLKIGKGKDGKIEKIGFSGQGCAISISSASMLSDMALGKSPKEAWAITRGHLLSEIGIDPGPSRLKCALLSYKVLKLALAKYFGKELEEEI